jgi:hypothetical protein
MTRKAFALAACLALLPVRLRAQTSPFVDEKTERLLSNELSGDLAFETMRITTRWHKLSGSPDFFAVAREVMVRAKGAGLSDVAWIDQKMDDPAWACRRAEAWLLEGGGDAARETKLGSYAEVATSIADFSRSADVTAELVDVGAGDRAADYAGRDVRGKVVLAFGNPSAVMEQAVWKRGAAGILAWSSTRLNALADAPDQIAWQRVPEKDGPNGEKTTFAFVLSARAGKALSDRLRGTGTRRIFLDEPGGAPPGLRVRIVVDAAFEPPQTAMVEARIPGREPDLPEIVLTSHLQESKFSANDDQSGIASTLEIGRTLARLIAEGRLPQPRRGIRFWWCDEIYSEYRYFADHPGEEKKILANLNQDMVGARQSLGGRVQHMSRTPWSRPSYLSDVQESVLEMVVAGNNAYLPAWQAGSIPPGVGFSKPIFSHLGSREPYGARAVPYFDSTDHLVFNDSWVAVPGTSLTNWPDEYIHSSADDLWQIDATQIKRNAFVVAATAWWLANAGGEEAALAAGHVAARGAGRIARALATAQERVAAHRPARAEDFRAAADLLAVALETEKAAVESTRELDPESSPGTGQAIQAGLSLLDQTARGAKSSLASAWAAAAGEREPQATPGAAEERLKSRIPKKGASTLDAWMELEHRVRGLRAQRERDRRAAAEKDAGRSPERGARKVPAAPAAETPKLSPLMESAVMNWVDGRTDAATIARRVCAEAMAAGAWYYGVTTPELVEKFLEEQARDGLIVW